MSRIPPFLPSGPVAGRERGSAAAERGGRGPGFALVAILCGTFRLGSRFTLAAQVKSRHRAQQQRLFSAYDPYPRRPELAQPYDREGWIGSRELVMDFEPGGSGDIGCLRLVVNGESVTAQGSFPAGEYQHLAATYDDGAVVLYLNGVKVGEGGVPGGPVALIANLRVGTDPGPMTGGLFEGKAPNRQLVGNVDDIVVLGRVLTPREIGALNREGAAAALP